MRTLPLLLLAGLFAIASGMLRTSFEKNVKCEKMIALLRLPVGARSLRLVPLAALLLLWGDQEELPQGGALHGRSQVMLMLMLAIKLFWEFFTLFLLLNYSILLSSYAGYVPNNALKCQRSRDRLLEQYQNAKIGWDSQFRSSHWQYIYETQLTYCHHLSCLTLNMRCHRNNTS